MSLLTSLKNNKMRWKFLKRGRQRLLFVGQNSGFHGMNRLFNPKASRLSRVFWLIIIIASVGGLYLMMEPVVELGVEINYTPDTLYLDWTTTFPGFTVCEELITKLVQRKFDALYPDLLKPINYNHRRYLTDLLHARNQCSNAQCNPCGTVIPCDVPWRDIIERIHKTCDEMLSDCSYNGVEFPCCHYYQRVDSEHGPCYAFNTLQHKEHKSLFVVNRTTGPGSLKFRLLSDAEISLHSSEELATNYLDSKLKRVIRTTSENEVFWSFSVVEIENDIMLKNEHIHERGCRYLHEVPDEKFHTYPVYSQGACQLARNTEETFEKCGCIHPARDLSYQKYFCNYTGMNCWNKYEDLRIKVGVGKSNAMNKCLPSCVESELTTVHFSKSWVSNKNDKPSILVNIKMASLPTLRYKRNLMRTHLDLVVSVGGIAGLFFSASILSFLEIFYLIFRPQKFQTL